MNAPADHRSKFLIGLLRVSLGAWFFYSGYQKLIATGLDRFVFDIGNYRMLPEPWDAVVAYLIPWAECLVGLCLIGGVYVSGACVILTGLVSAFAIGITWAKWHKLVISCGCHGDGAMLNYTNKYLEFAGYYLLIAILFARDCKVRRRTTPTQKEI